MDQSKNVEVTESTLPISRRKPSAPRVIGAVKVASPLLATGNSLLLAILRELRGSAYPIELRNVLVDGKWVADIRLSGQMWTEDGGLKQSEVNNGK